ncbi:MAG: glycosyltransferase [Paludibacteraceae bacterium]|nr:glycosyltransferase [Paludibacteraceae bacterium]
MKKTGKNPGFQIIKFSRLILDGFIQNHSQVSALTNIITSTKKIAKSSTEIENNIHYHCLPYIQIPIIQQILQFVYSFFYTLVWCIRTEGDKIILCDIFASSCSMGSVVAAQLMRTPKTMLLTDMLIPPATISQDTKKWWWKMFFKMRVRSQENGLKKYDGFIFLTKYMNMTYNPNQKPYIVMEGSVDHTFIPKTLTQKVSPRVIMYAGAIEAEYGFDTLVRAFISLSQQDIELHVYGGGKFVENLLEFQQIDSRIQYKGVVTNEEIIIAEQEATLLVNPRYSNQEFVKYSFPSKTSEYMLSGTPVLTTKLSGIPDEYFKYLYAFDEETIEGYAHKLNEILSLPNEELKQTGLKAQEFVLKNKNNTIQAQRIEEFFRTLITKH